MHRIRLTCCALLLWTVGVAHAGIDNAGTTAGNFLSVGSGASILSMGGATLGSGTDLHAAAWNPAALGYLSETQFAVGHSALAMESAQEWLAAGGRLSHGATRWSVDALYQSEGGFEGRDALNNSTGSFKVSNMALGARLARPFGNAMHAGLGVRWVNENLGDAKGSGLGFDAGLQAHSGPFGFGLAARNVGGKLKYAAGSYDLPGVFGAGISWSHPTAGVRVNLDANFPNAYYNDVRLGAEWRWQDRLALRAGYRKELNAPSDEPLSGPSFGLGVGAGGMWLDYGFLVGGSEVQGQHRIGLTFRPGLLKGGLAAAAEPTVEPSHRRPPSEPVALADPTPSTGKPLRLTLVADASAGPSSRRASEPEARLLVASRPVRAPKLMVSDPEREPSAKRESKPKQAASVGAAPVAMTDEVAPIKQPSVVEAQPVASRAPQVEIVRPAPVKAPEVPTPKPVARPTVVVVKAGETLAGLARLYENSVTALMMENNLVSDQVKPGQKLRLPPAGRR